MRRAIWLLLSTAAFGCGNESSDPPQTVGDSEDLGSDGETSTGTDEGDSASERDSFGGTDTDTEDPEDMNSDGAETDDTEAKDSSGERDSQGEGDSSTEDARCPEGSTAHTTSSGVTVCCTESYPHFCDEDDAGYAGGCWSEGVDCETLVYCGDRYRGCLDGSVSYCDAEGDFACYACPEDSARYETASGKPVCCASSRPTFCDENDIGYGGGCWSEGVDCDTITVCGENFTACREGSLPYCGEAGDLICYPCAEGTERHETASGRPVCCASDRPTFCDENSAGYAGGCWGEGIDCGTVIYCGAIWGACAEGRTSSCVDGALRCLEDDDV